MPQHIIHAAMPLHLSIKLLLPPPTTRKCHLNFMPCCPGIPSLKNVNPNPVLIHACLSTQGRYAELAALYQYHKCHAKGLDLLRRVSLHPEQLPVAPTGAASDLPGLPGVWAAVRCVIYTLGNNGNLCGPCMLGCMHKDIIWLAALLIHLRMLAGRQEGRVVIGYQRWWWLCISSIVK
jgi:hypothetical protein